MIEPEHIDFVNTRFRQVEGWCLDESAYMTLHLMSVQRTLGLNSSIFEIGVYKGKYLSVLFEGSRRTQQTVLGIDTFQWSKREEVLFEFQRLFGTDARLKLVAADSTRLDAPQIIDWLDGKKASFVSVDGDHSAAVVGLDLTLCKSVLSEGGIIAIDDFLNPHAIGVSEGVYRFFLHSPAETLRPFVYCANKLFCAEDSYALTYSKSIWDLIERMPDFPMIRDFKRQLDLGRAYVEQELLGSKVLILWGEEYPPRIRDF